MPKDTTIAWRLRKAMQQNEKSAKEISSQVGVTTAALSQYMTGAREPSIKVLIGLAQSLNVSTDYLLGLAPSMQVTGPDAVITKKYGLRDSTVQIFAALNDAEYSSVESETDFQPRTGKYRVFSDEDAWMYVRNMDPISDVQSFLLDFFEGEKMHRMLDAVFYYQFAASYMRQFYDRHEAYKNDLTPKEQECVRQMCIEHSELEDTRFIWGVPLVFYDKAEKFKAIIKNIACEIIDDCCDNFEVIHDQDFRQAKKDFIARMKSLVALQEDTSGRSF